MTGIRVIRMYPRETTAARLRLTPQFRAACVLATRGRASAVEQMSLNGNRFMSNGAASRSSMTTPNGGFRSARMLVALILGASSPWVGGALSVLAGYVVLPLMQDLLQA